MHFKISSTSLRLIVLLLFISSFSYAQDSIRPSKVYAGVYLNDVSDFDTKEGRFKADLYLWLKWLGPQDIPPVFIANAEIDKMEITNRETENDWHSVRWRVQGTFRGNFPLFDYPFDRQKITLALDMPAEWGELIPDQAGSGMNPKFSITGWLYEPYFEATKVSKTFASDLGSIEHEGLSQKVSEVNYVLRLERPFSANFIKLIIPLMIILMMATLSFFLSAKQLVVKNGMVVTALLSCVAFHFSQSESLPDVSYLVAADKFFLWAYSLIIFALIGVVTSFRISQHSERLSLKIDRVFVILLPVLAVIAAYSVSGKYTHYEEARLEATAQPERAIKTSSRNTLNKAVPVLPDLSESQNEALYMRGLYYTGKNGDRIPHMVKTVPDMTNNYIKLLADGGITVRWELKDNIKWGDGVLISAKDLVFSLNCVEDENRREIIKVDDRTVDVVYDKRKNYVISKFDIFPKHRFEKVFAKGGLDSIQEIIKTNPPPMDGPYILKKFIPEKYAEFTKNPHFIGNEPRIANIKISVNKDGERWLNPKEILEQGKADLISLMSKGAHNYVANLDGFTNRIDTTSNLIFFLQPDLSVYPFTDVRVRQAISYALDRKAIITQVDDGAGMLANSGYFDQLDEISYQYNITKAKDLLKEAKVPAGQQIKFMGYTRGEGAPEQFVIDQIIENLSEIGLTVDFVALDQSPENKLRKGNHGGLLYYEGTKDDIGMFWNVPYNENTGHFEMHKSHKLFDKEVLKINERYEGSMFPERRGSLSRKMQLEYANSLPTIPIFSISYRSVYDSKLVGWNPMAADQKNIWWNVEDWYFKK